MAKGLGGGFPIGAIWISDQYSELFQPGSHGTTFGGNPLASAAANAVIDIIEEEGLLENVRKLSMAWHSNLGKLQAKYPDQITAIRGRGFMVGIGVNNAPKIVELARDKGLLIVPAGMHTVRLLPPLISSESDLAESVAILEAVFKAL
jgi:acetylornithine aminotransferase/acetylornithine/N-succinyldiaminopimelate aminotransferase